MNDPTKTEYNKKDIRYRYMLLARLQQDCLYYLGFGNRLNKCLWAGNPVVQINEMKEIYNSFKKDEKPQWLTFNQILSYEKDMIN